MRVDVGLPRPPRPLHLVEQKERRKAEVVRDAPGKSRSELEARMLLKGFRERNPHLRAWLGNRDGEELM